MSSFHGLQVNNQLVYAPTVLGRFYFARTSLRFTAPQQKRYNQGGFMQRVLIFIVLCIFSLSSQAQIDFSATVHCSYQKGQYLSKDKSENVHNSKPLNWAFNNLSGKKPIYISGGDTGEVITIPLDLGVIIYLPDSTGTHTFTVWNNGQSFWAKQMNLLGTLNAQQYIGSCAN
jgi:hypothetical protein